MAGLREQAAADCAAIMADSDGGFSLPITITGPDGTVYPDVPGLSNDIGQLIDPDTGTIISGRQASAAISFAALVDAGITGDYPRSIPDESGKPWLYSFNDIAGVTGTFKVVQSSPDRTIGQVTAIIEVYKP